MSAAPVRVVTGGAGFIGSHLVDALLARGDRVRIVDDFSTGSRARVNPAAELVEADVAAEAGRAVAGADEVYHLAARPSVPRSVKQPLECHRATARSTLEVLRAAEAAGVRRVVLAGSSSVYGDTEARPKSERLPPRPLSPYAVAKLAAELYMASWAARGRPETVSVRFFNVYGPRQDPASAYAAVIPIFARCVLEGRPMPVHGDGEQTRDFTYVGDVVRGLLLAGRAPGVSGRVYNLAGGSPVSVLELGRTIAELAGVAPKFDHRPPRPGDVRDSCADPAAAARDLGFRAGTPLREGLRATLEAMRS